MVIAANLVAWRLWRSRRAHEFDPAFQEAARRYAISPALVKAVAWHESRCDPGARGRAGEIGLMQLMEDAALEWATASRATGFVHEHAFDPVTNTLAGAYYLSKLLRRYTNTDDPLPYALADYNAGRGNVLRWMQGPAATNSTEFRRAITFPATRAYIDAVTGRYHEYLGTPEHRGMGRR